MCADVILLCVRGRNVNVNPLKGLLHFFFVRFLRRLNRNGFSSADMALLAGGVFIRRFMHYLFDVIFIRYCLWSFVWLSISVSVCIILIILCG